MCMSGIALGIVDREVSSGDPAGSNKQVQELCELFVVESWTSRRVDRGHDFLVEDVEIHMQPGLLECAGVKPREDAVGTDIDTLLDHALRGEPGGRGLKDVAIVLFEPRLVRAALADLNNISIFDERRADVRPVGEEFLPSPARERKVHARGGA